MTARHEPDRRDFLKWSGFSLAALAVSGCGRAPERQAVPFVDKPEELTPGRATWYATMCGGCEAGCGLLAKYRDGRPIKLEGNPAHPLSQGGTCAIGQAHVLSLYDSQRLDAPVVDGKPTTWAAADARVRAGLAAAQAAGKAVRVLTGTVNGPTLSWAIDGFLRSFADGRHVMYDALSCAALADAHAELFGRRVVPAMRFERAQRIVSFDADFLGTWISPVSFTRGYQAARALSPDGTGFARHVQFESRLSLTGCSADERLALVPAERESALAALAAEVAKRAGTALPWSPPAVAGLPAGTLEKLADALWAAPRGRTLVVCGANRLGEQKLVATLNHLLGNYGAGGTLDLDRPSQQALGDDVALEVLRAEIAAGKVGALLIAGCNPLYDLPEAEKLRADLAGVPLVVSTAHLSDETSAVAHVVCPDHHPLEAWRDAEPVVGLLTVGQPTLRPLRGTRAWIESLTAFAGKPAKAYDLMRTAWRERVFPRQHQTSAFDAFWARAVHDGYVELDAPPGADTSAFALERVKPSLPWPAAGSETLALVLYPKVALGDGRHAHNPWLQEVPDPVSKVSWDNYAVLAPAAAAKLGVETGDLIALSSGYVVCEVPVLVQPGQREGVLALALGYGRAGTYRFADVGPTWLESRPTVAPGALVGINAAPLVVREGAYRTLDMARVAVQRTGGRRELASSQLHHRLEEPAHLRRAGDGPRPIAQETTLAAWREDPGAGAPHEHPSEGRNWDDDHLYKGHHWAMAVDLTRCTGCSACVLACQAENNVPVVGQDEMRRQRDMHWIRIDRYFQGEGADTSAIHQPMLCQQCDNAPCESVCPVLATVHSSEGLNQQVYNRCVGTRYCSNNCPYKVRRFNWFDYPREDRLQNMVLNPDVTVRSRGVMEKCTFCVQRIQEAKAEAKRTGAAVDVVPACMQACPAGAISFGDRNVPESEIAKKMVDPRSYRVLEELDVEPSVHYLRRVRDRAKEKRHG